MNNEHVDKSSPYNFGINYVNIQVHLEIINFKIQIYKFKTHICDSKRVQIKKMSTTKM